MPINDIATLGIQVTTDGVSTAKRSLDDLAASGDRAAASTANLNKSFSQGTGTSARQASANYREQQDALAKLAGQIDPTIAALGRLDAQQAKLAAFKKAGMLGADDFNALNDAIELNRVKFTAAGNALHQFSLNNSFARRELGRLAADLANGNWGRFEQTSLTLANASGLLGMAFSATGAMVLGAVAAMGLFAIGAERGWAESEKLRVSLIATGGAAGTSATALNSMADDVGRATGHWGDARKALDDMAASGKFAGAGLSGLATAAVDASTVTGLSIDKIIAQFEKLQDQPAKAVAALNDQYHFLTAAEYAEIAALEEQGRTRDAARVAETAYTEAMKQRAQEVADNAGWLLRSAHAVRDGWNEAWASLKGAGAPLGLQDKINIAQEKIDQLQGGRILPNGTWQAGAGSDDPRVKALQAEIDNLRHQQVVAAFADNAQQLKDRANADSIAAQQRLGKFKTPKQALDDSLAQANADKLAALYGVVDPTQRARIEAEYQEQVTRAKQAYDSAVKKRGPHGADPFASLNSQRDKAYNQYADAASVDSGASSTAQAKLYEQEVQQLQAIAKAGAEAIEKGGDLARVQAEVADATSKVTATFALESQQLSAKNAAALKAYQDAIDDQIAAKQRQLDLQVASVGMGTKEAQQMQAIDAIYAKVSSTIEQLNRQRAQKSADTQLIDGQIAAQKASLPILVKQQQDAYSAMSAAQASWENGAIKGMQDFVDEGQNVAGLTASFFTTAFNDMGTALANFATTGSINFRSLATSILTDLARMETCILESQALQAILGAFTGGVSYGGGSGGATGTGAFSGFGAIATQTVSYNANGGVFMNSPSLSAYSGSVVNSPTPFMFAAGAGIMGEAGPEAILPLRRGPDGKLGVASGGSGGAAVTINVNVDNSGAATQQTTSTSNAYAHQFAQAINAKVREGIANEQRPGGLLWRMAHA
ncbi:phage tail tape measure protein [Dyella agri]|uniref:Phage tail tape measure protein n=1 Tax=Dyella agri TaxID=1926869 RepID=A0ABW8KAX3_9GAMM